MAKRKRLAVPLMEMPEGLETKAFAGGWTSEAYGRPAAPIADVAGETAAQAALADLADEIARSRREGRLVVSLPLAAIDEGYLVRDRLAMDEDELAELVASLGARGQQVPIEVTETGPGRYGLISGWRRLTALRRLHDETAEARFAEVLCLIRQPHEIGDAYRAMVEENEIRAGISFYERARIAVRAVEKGAFSDTESAVKTLFSAMSRPKRSKVRSFIAVYLALDPALRFPRGMPERLGLALAGALEGTTGFSERVTADLAAAAPRDAAAERQVLERALKPAPRTGAEATPEVAPGVRMEIGRGRLVLSGPGVDESLCAALQAWLAER